MFNKVQLVSIVYLTFFKFTFILVTLLANYNCIIISVPIEMHLGATADFRGWLWVEWADNIDKVYVAKRGPEQPYKRLTEGIRS